MTKLAKAPLKSKIADFVNRVPPFDGNALIQKTEDKTIRDDVVDSMMSEIPSSASINNPAQNFNVDFTTSEVQLINTTASAHSGTFNLTLQNLNGNVIGKINVTKRSGDLIAFANGTVVPYDNTDGQNGLTTLQFLVYIVNGVYKVERLFDFLVPTAGIKDDAVTVDKIADDSITLAMMTDDSVDTDELVDGAVTQAKTSGISYAGISTNANNNTNTGVFGKAKNTGTNFPVTSRGLLNVASAGLGEIIQTFQSAETPYEYFVRSSTNSGSTWTGWTQVV